MAFLVVSWPVGIGLALVVLGPLAAATSWKVALQASTLVCASAFVLLAFIYRDPPGATAAASAPTAARLRSRELLLVSLAGAVWTLYNVAYIIVVSFAPLLLVDRGLQAANAALITSAATWPLALTIPVGGVLADRTGRGDAIMIVCFAAMAVSIPFMLTGPSPLFMLAFVALIMGPAAGIIMTLPACAVRQEARNLAMGVYYTWYYAGMALLPGVAGWSRDVSGIAAAPLVCASALLILAIASLLIFRWRA
jgi:MFS family permease